ncbi:PREDICTED: putative F-box protein PP2-B8 [Camelina sativa]|uniref:F-box protein PP2-B8 n=1 Tax=Camelina sativa TaxID=90675 RepID=A0ABM0ZCY7_CAMSA|nr:PREDICTED: putative F-box protein PP2-B8 [Camelina sativa]
MSKTRSLNETRSLFTIKDHFHKFVERLKKTLRLSASNDDHGVAKPLYLDDLPEECISVIISLTSPQDACIFASVSKTFESAAKSNIVWEKFIPPEYASLVPRPQDYSSKKDLYFALCDESVLIDDDKKSFWVEQANGKRCIMLSAMNLSIMWGNILHSWKQIPNPQARFEKVGELLEERWFEIRGKINTRVLSPKTRYSVYIVFMKADICYGFADVAIEAVVGVVGQYLQESSRRYLCFDEAMKGFFLRREMEKKNLVKPKSRKDGWMELELGEFFNEGGLMSSDEIEMSVLKTKRLHWKRGLIVQGIEIRPVKIR